MTPQHCLYLFGMLTEPYDTPTRDEATDLPTEELAELAMFTPEEADDNESTNQGARLKREDVTLPRKKHLTEN